MDEQSQNTDPLPSTNPQQNWSNTKDYLVTVSSCMYATIIVTFGIALQVAIPFIGLKPGLIYCIILCCIGMAYHIYLLSDIGRYISILIKSDKAEGGKQIEVEYNAEDDKHDCTPVIGEYSRKDQSTLISYPRDYCFKYGRHSGSLFLKAGAAVLVCGHLIHSVLLITVQVTQFFDVTVDNKDCVVIEQLVLDVLAPCNKILQIYFIFKYSKIVIMKRKDLAHWAIMHIIGTCICFWLAAIMRETFLALIVFANSVYNKHTLTLRSMMYLNESEKILNFQPVPRFFNISIFYNAHCKGSTLMIFVQHVSPYLYPFCIESNVVLDKLAKILTRKHFGIGIIQLLYQSLYMLRIPHQDTYIAFKKTLRSLYRGASQGSTTVAMILIVIIAGTLLLAYVFNYVGGEFVMFGHHLREVTMLCLNLILLTANLMAFKNLRTLDINEHPVSVLDDVLLFICIPAFTLQLTLSLLATSNIISSINYMIMGVEMFVQTLTIMDGLRRCSNTIEMQRTQPGRGVIAFLVIINMGMWIYYTFAHPFDEVDERNIFYGKVTWTILGHVSLPLIMFYTFHSSVCFADIWKSAYKPGARH